MRKKRKKSSTKLGFIFIFLLISLASISISYSHWTDTIQIQGSIKMGHWNTCINISKTLDDQGCTEGLRLIITVSNNGSTALSNVTVTDRISKNATPIPGTLSDINASFDTYAEGVINTLTWNIGDLSSKENASLSMCINISCVDGVCKDAVVNEPQPPGPITVPRYNHTGGNWETGSYTVEHLNNNRSVKFENIEPNLGEEGLVQTDTFVINVSGGGNKIDVTTVAGQLGDTITLEPGDSVVDDTHHTITFVSVINVGEYRIYTFDVTSDNKTGGEGSWALSHIEFDFGSTCTIEINEGAQVTAEANTAWCDSPLQATTQSITISIEEDCNNVVSPSLPYSTPWAWDCCNN